VKNELRTATNLQMPAASDTVLFASVMAVLWAFIATIVWTVLAVAFGRSRGNVRLVTMLVLGAVVVALLCGHAYRRGWKSRR